MVGEGEELKEDSSKTITAWHLRKIKCEFLDVLYMITTFHENMRWFDAKTDKPIMQAKQLILCKELKFWPKISNLKHECTSWNFHVGSWRNMFQSKMKSLSWVLDEKYACNPELVGQSHGKFDEWKVFKFEEVCFELR